MKKLFIIQAFLYLSLLTGRLLLLVLLSIMMALIISMLVAPESSAGMVLNWLNLVLALMENIPVISQALPYLFRATGSLLLLGPPSWDGSSRAQLGFSIDGEAEGQESGSSVSLSGDGMGTAWQSVRSLGANSYAGNTLTFTLKGYKITNYYYCSSCYISSKIFISQ